MVLQLGEQPLNPIEPALPLCAHRNNERQRLGYAVFQQLRRCGIAHIARLDPGQVCALKKLGKGIAQGQLVAQAQLDINAFDAIGVLGHARQRNDHVFVDLEGIGVAADGCRLFAVQPEFFARLRADGDKAFTAA